jgi:hypothetical protein
MKPGSAKDSAVRGLVTFLASDSGAPDFAAAMIWAQAASTAENQTSLTKQVRHYWKQKVQDFPAAVKSSDLSETLKATLLAP